MKPETMNKITNDLKTKYPDVGIHSIEVDDSTGKSTFFLKPTNKALAFLDKPGMAVIPRQFKDKASTINRTPLDRSVLDLAQKDAYTEEPHTSFERAMKYYYVDPLVGSATNLLASLACKGFENDIDDLDIKNFYDVWMFDVNFEELIEWIFLDFFKVGHVTTYKVIAKYEPRTSYLSPIPGKTLKTSTGKEKAAKKKIWSKGHLPVSFTVLNPLLVNIEGNLLFNNNTTKLTFPDELKELLKKPAGELTAEDKALIKALPADLKAAVKAGDEFQLDPRLVGSITYRKQPYERYAKPRSARIFDSLEYKRALREADLSTLDGISNYILKITVGSDDYPVTSQKELESAAQLFNTPSKSFDVVWNHTLKVEKIVSPEIEAILGKTKYEQVNEDISGGLAVARALIDGVGDTGVAEASLVVKGLIEEINYARRQVTKWIYNEYRLIAEAVGFERFPKIRWDDGILKDTILYMNILGQLVDRRMLSYRTALEQLGFDFPNERNNMEEELDLVMDGTFGLRGSPFQQTKMQPTQTAPAGTPSNGRPSGEPAKPKEPTTEPKPKVTKPKKSASVVDVVKDMPDEVFLSFIHELTKARIDKDKE